MKKFVHLSDPLSPRSRWRLFGSRALRKVSSLLSPRTAVTDSAASTAPFLDYRAELQGPKRGRALLSYLARPFHARPDASLTSDYSNWLMAVELANALNRLGYVVDVIDYLDLSFVPSRKYEVFVGMTANFTRLLPFVQGARTIYWGTRPEASVELEAIRQRQAALLQRRNCFIPVPDSIFPLLESPDYHRADGLLLIGNKVTERSFFAAPKHVFCIDNPALPINGDTASPRNYLEAHRHFLFLSSWLLLRKGLDIVLETFASHPDLHLWIAGPVETERPFLENYRTELFHTPNIHTLGWLSMQSPTFAELCSMCGFIVFPSCAEGMSGSVINGMTQGLIPICSPEAGVDLEDFGYTLEEATPSALGELVTRASQTPSARLEELSGKARRAAVQRYTVDNFRVSVESALRTVLHS